MCMDILFTCISLYHMYAWYPQRLEYSIGFPGTRITGSCELSYDLGIELSLLKEQQIQVTITATPDDYLIVSWGYLKIEF